MSGGEREFAGASAAVQSGSAIVRRDAFAFVRDDDFNVRVDRLARESRRKPTLEPGVSPHQGSRGFQGAAGHLTEAPQPLTQLPPLQLFVTRQFALFVMCFSFAAAVSDVFDGARFFEAKEKPPDIMPFTSSKRPIWAIEAMFGGVVC